MTVMRFSNLNQLASVSALDSSEQAAPAFWTIFDWMFFAVPGALLVLDLALTASGPWSDALGFSVNGVLLAVVASYAIVVRTASATQVPRALLWGCGN